MMFDLANKVAVGVASVATAAGLAFGCSITPDPSPSAAPKHGPAASATQKSGAHIPPPDDKITPVTTTHLYLGLALPYFGRQAPAWCLEDMPCWIGSKADGRTDAEILRSLSCDLLTSSYAYSSSDEGYRPEDFDRCTEED